MVDFHRTVKQNPVRSGYQMSAFKTDCFSFAHMSECIIIRSCYMIKECPAAA